MNDNRNQIRIYLIFVLGICWALGIVAVLLLIYNRIYHYRMGKIKRISNIQSKRLALYLHSGKIQIWTYDVERDVFATFTNDGDKDEEYNRLSFSVFFNEEDYNKIYAAIEVQKQKLAELDGEASKLVNLTEQTAKEPVSVRGKAYEGSTVIINGIKYMLTAEVRRVIFKLRNKQVVMVAL